MHEQTETPETEQVKETPQEIPAEEKWRFEALTKEAAAELAAEIKAVIKASKVPHFWAGYVIYGFNKEGEIGRQAGGIGFAPGFVSSAFVDLTAQLGSLIEVSNEMTGFDAKVRKHLGLPPETETPAMAAPFEPANGEEPVVAVGGA